jgi:hypothetical protein
MAAVDYTATVPALTTDGSHDLLTLNECKLLLGMSTTDTTHDAQLALQISIYSQTIERMCNRILAKETGIEAWREDGGSGRVFLTHFPVKAADIQSVSVGGSVLDPSAYTLEERSGKLAYRGVVDAAAAPWPLPVYVTYTGGYDLPAEAPYPLKQAAVILIMEARLRMVQAQVAGIRQVSHREARVTFFDPNAVLLRLGGKSPSMQAVEALINQYTRLWV